MEEKCNSHENNVNLDVFKDIIPGQGMFSGHSASVVNWSPHHSMFYLDYQTSCHSSPVLCSGLKAQSGWSEPGCFCRWDTKKSASVILESREETLN